MIVFRRFTFVLWIGILVLAAPPARPQEELQTWQPDQEEPARFLLETITIEGAQPAAARIVRAESLLEEGRSYSEEELRQAVYRIQRLPIVLESSFALRKGGRRGAYELVIQVRQARRFFYDHTVRLSRFGEPLSIDSLLGEEDTVSLPGLVGLRQFVGPTGVLFAALDSQEGLQVGYSQYDLFGRGIVASLGYAWTGACCVTEVVPYGLDPRFTAWDFDTQQRLTLNLAVPLSGRQSVQLAAAGRRGEARLGRRVLVPETGLSIFDDGRLDADELTELQLATRWVYDTTDDPLLPTRGLSFAAGIEAAALRLDGVEVLRYDTLPGPLRVLELPDQESETVSAVVTAARHWPLTPRQTVSATGRASAGRSWLRNVQDLGRRLEPGQEVDADVDVYGVAAGVRHAVSLWRGRQPHGFGDLSLESTVEAGRETASPDLGFTATPLTRLEVSTGLVYRHQWGLLRLQLTYLDLQEHGR